MGVYELLRRRCRFILAVDAGADPRLGKGGSEKGTGPLLTGSSKADSVLWHHAKN
jgi:hypothetical protein